MLNNGLKYLILLVLGMLVWIVSVYIFSLSARYSPIIDFLKNIENLNKHSQEYLLLALHDSFIKFLISFILLYGYIKLYAKSALNFLSSLVIQAPSTFFTIYHAIEAAAYTEFPNFSSYYDIVNLITFTTSCTSVLLIYWFISSLRKNTH